MLVKDNARNRLIIQKQNKLLAYLTKFIYNTQYKKRRTGIKFEAKQKCTQSKEEV